MSENGEKKEKVSIADALEQLRQGKAANSDKPSATSAAAAAATQQRQQRIPPSFWLTNLQDSIQRRRDQLFDKISEDASGQAGMNRRDLVATESFFLPAEMVQEMQPPAAPSQRIADVSRFQDIEVLTLHGGNQEEIQQAPPVPQAMAPIPQVLTTRFEGVMPMEAGCTVEEVNGSVAAGNGAASPFRFDGMGEEFAIDGLELEEVQTEVVESEEKKFRVNPMFRQMFQNLGNKDQADPQSTE